MFRKRVGAKAVLLAVLFGASSLLAQQQTQPTGVTQNGTPNAPNASEVMAKGHLDGQRSAENVGTGGWMAGGVVTGLLTGLIGTAVIWAVAGSSDVSVPAENKVQIASENATYQQAYESGYGNKLKSSRKSSALVGGLLGTAILVLLVVNAGSSQ